MSSSKDFQTLEKLGDGTFSSVYRGNINIYSQTSLRWAILRNEKGQNRSVKTQRKRKCPKRSSYLSLYK